MKLHLFTKRMIITATALSTAALIFIGALPSVQAETTANMAKAVKITNVGGDFPLLLDDQGYIWATSVSSRAYRKNLFPNRGNFVRMDNMSHVVSLSSRFALKDDGSVWAIEYDKSLDEDLDKWGIYTPRQIKQIPGLEHIEKIYSGLFALDRDGKLWFVEPIPFWAKLDDSPKAEQRPLLINGIDHVKDISGIQILKEDGSVWTWECQQSCDFSSPPVQIQGLDNIAKLTGYGLALKKDGTVWMWGRSVLATPKNEDQVKGAAPFQVEGLSDIVDLSYSGDRLLALKKDGTVWGMGYFPKTHEQMIDSFHMRFYPEYYRDPAPIEGLTDAAAVFTGNRTNAVIKKDGSLWMWGYDLHGTFGQAQSFQPIPTRVKLSPDTE